MTLKEIITKGIDIYIDSKFKNSDVRRFLKTHERRELLENNLLKEISKATKRLPEADTVAAIVKDFTNMFCKAAIEAKEKELRGNITT